MTRRKLPIGIQTFRRIREDDCYYVDKTACIRRLLDEGTHYFLSRPRRFGKSLFLDTCKELFEGNEALFEFKVVEMELRGAAMAQLKERRYSGSGGCRKPSCSVRPRPPARGACSGQGRAA